MESVGQYARTMFKKTSDSSRRDLIKFRLFMVLRIKEPIYSIKIEKGRRELEAAYIQLP